MVGDMSGNQCSANFHCTSSMPFAPFSALTLLRNYNQLLIPSEATPRYQHLISPPTCPIEELPIKISTRPDSPEHISPGSERPLAVTPLQNSPFVSTHPLFSYQHVPPLFRPRDNAISPVFGRTLINNLSPRRQRGEKKPIPEEQKDEKYFERRRRNNQAAKKSRDARKMREDQIAFRATMLEHENAILRAQIITLREEASSLRQLLMAKKSEQTQQGTER